ncbi:hypothetical protein BDV39DRAFT_199094 [Aspergillus sergii]|uniref:Uncharacterized protein n=1 Tax=Aspergillus sergii TaxID=1034303 RepID=A0A5N6XKK0_9EURO|nr:hypothetical protein BDV39DRAFT_199094 [Aspergillus sergii]
MRFTPKFDTSMVLSLYNSGPAFLLNWARTEDKNALEKVLIVTRQSVECTPEGDDAQIDSVAWSPAHAFRRAAQLVPNNHPTLSNSRALLRNGLLVRFQAQGDLQDIDSVLSASREAAAAAAGENDQDAWALYHLGSQLDFKYVITGDVESLRGQCLRELFGYTGDISELERAITDCKQAAKIMPEDYYALPGILQRLAFSFQEQYQLSGEMKYLEEAIEISHRWLSLASIYGHDMSKFLSTLGSLEKAYALATAAIGVLPLVRTRMRRYPEPSDEWPE